MNMKESTTTKIGESHGRVDLRTKMKLTLSVHRQLQQATCEQHVLPLTPDSPDGVWSA